MTDSIMKPDYLDHGYILESVTLKEDGRILLTYAKKDLPLVDELVYNVPVDNDRN